MKKHDNQKYRGISIFSSTFEVDMCKLLEENEKQTLLHDLAELKSWCQKDSSVTASLNDQYRFFEEAIIGAYCRYVTAKKKVWSPFKNLCAVIVTSLIPIISGLFLRWFSEDSIWSIGDIGFCAGIILAIVWFLLESFQTAQKRRAYSETWVRHSACYGRLRLALSRFLISNCENHDYKVFVDEVFSVLEQNYNQFTVNLCPNGVANS